jgi:hypothetical protein
MSSRPTFKEVRAGNTLVINFTQIISRLTALSTADNPVSVHISSESEKETYLGVQ